VYPASQLHAVLPATELALAMHSEHELLPRESAYLPPAHCAQPVAPADMAYEPRLHSTHCPLPISGL